VCLLLSNNFADFDRIFTQSQDNLSLYFYVKKQKHLLLLLTTTNSLILDSKVARPLDGDYPVVHIVGIKHSDSPLGQVN
jgi:hypothetical protein